MKKRTIATIAMIAAILMTVSGAELAFARGGGKKGGSCNGKGPGYKSGAGMSQAGNMHQYQYGQQNEYQYRQNKGAYGAQSGNRQTFGEQAQSRVRKQIRDPETHVSESAE